MSKNFIFIHSIGYIIDFNHPYKQRIITGPATIFNETSFQIIDFYKRKT
jgi:hypothetical protein